MQALGQRAVRIPNRGDSGPTFSHRFSKWVILGLISLIGSQRGFSSRRNVEVGDLGVGLETEA